MMWYMAMLQKSRYTFTAARCLQMTVRVKAYQKVFFDIGGIRA